MSRPKRKSALKLQRAKALQEKLRALIELTPLPKKIRLVAGADAAFFSDRVIAVACLFTYPGLGLVDEAFVLAKARFPYIPGFLAFREGPAIIRAVKKLKERPDVLLIDGQGIAHPRGLGIASHVGVVLDMPTIGCAKSRLVGQYKEPNPKKGSRSALKFKGQTVGAALRTKDGTNVMFISPGHKVSFPDAIKISLACAARARVPEPTRVADIKTKKLKKLLLHPAPEPPKISEIGPGNFSR